LARAHKALVVQAILANRGAKPLYVLRGFNPYRLGWDRNASLGLLASTTTGKPLRYTGISRMVMRPDASSFIRLEPGCCYGNVVNLLDHYWGLGTPGQYVVRFRYQVFTRPKGLAADRVWNGTSNEAVCRIKVVK
jgi:hypothetical protein